MKAEDGGPAFPQIETTFHMEGHAGEYTPISDVHSIGGMTMRDYFAARAMQALVHCATDQLLQSGGLKQCIPDLAAIAYKAADALLVAREVQSCA